METMAPSGAPAATTGPGWVGSALKRGRGLGVVLAVMGFAAALIYEVTATVVLIRNVGTLTMPAESTLRVWAWQYDYGSVITEYFHAPLLVFGFLLVGLIVMSVKVAPVKAIQKAKGRAMATRWSYAEERAHLRHDMGETGYTTLVTTGFRVRSAVAAVVAMALMGLALIAPSEPGFTAGLGPTVVLVSAGVALVGLLLARPWEAATPIAVGPGGRLVVGAGAVPPSIAATPVLPPSGWSADPSGRHELRFWDGTRWTSHVSDHGELSEDAVPDAA